MAEWFKATICKIVGLRKSFVGSNPTATASVDY